LIRYGTHFVSCLLEFRPNTPTKLPSTTFLLHLTPSTFANQPAESKASEPEVVAAPAPAAEEVVSQDPLPSSSVKSDDKKPVKVKKVVKELPPRKSGRARKPKKIDDDFVTGDDEEDLN
jgi:hypothetical protein